MLLHLGGSHSIDSEQILAILPLDEPLTDYQQQLLKNLQDAGQVQSFSNTPKTLVLASQDHKAPGKLNALYVSSSSRTLEKRLQAHSLPVNRKP